MRLGRNKVALGSVLLAALLAGTGPAVAAGPWYVATNGTSANGLGWTTAFTNLQLALDAASTGDTIYVAGHIFYVTNPVSWTKNDISILGQCATNAEPPTSMAVTPTIIQRSANSVRVMAISNVTNGVLNRLTIAGGNTGSGVPGAGIYCSSCANLLVASCTITNNNAGDNGGGFYSLASSVTLTNCMVSDNRVNNQGGGQYYGGGLAAAAGTGSVNLWGCVVANNRVTVQPGASKLGLGGGVYSAVPVVLRNCLIYGNEANTSGNGVGDGVYLVSGSLSMGIPSQEMNQRYRAFDCS